MKRFIILPLVIVLGVIVSLDGLRAIGPLTPQEQAGDEISRPGAIKANFDKLVSEDKEVKREALLYFGKVDKTFAAEVPLFTAALKDKRYQVRAISAYALGKIGGAAVGSIPDVEKLLSDSSASVQKYAKWALDRLQPFKPAPKKLTAAEAADALALLIGEWEGKGQRKDKDSDWVPASIELKDVIRWKEKGKSIEGTFQLVVDGKQEPARAYEKTYDPAIGLFILRGGMAGSELKLTEHRRYDPATRTFQTISFFPELPEGLEGHELKFKFSITESGRISYIFEIYEDGKLWGEQKLDARRKPSAPETPKKLTAAEAADALALLIGEWEGKGQRKDKDSDWVPASLELKDVARWKEKGKSIEGTFQLVVDGKEEPAWAYEYTYDPVSGLFIVRGGRVGSELKLTEHRRYDPATRTFQTISFFPEREGSEWKSKSSITESGRFSGIFEIYRDGELWGEQKLDARRKPSAPETSKKLTAEEASDAMAYWIGRWEFTGEDVASGESPLKQVGTLVFTWEKKGQSINGSGTVRYGTGAEIALSSDRKFDPVSGLFIWRSREAGNKGRIILLRYDPKTQIYHDKGVAGGPGVKEVTSVRVTGPDSARWSFEVFNQGKLVFSSKGEMKRARENSGSEPLEGRLTNLHTLTGRGEGSHHPATWSPDGGRIAAAGKGKTVKVWDAASGREIHTLKGHQKNEVGFVIWSPDGSRLASGNLNTARVWDAASGRELRSFKDASLRAGSWSPAGDRLVTSALFRGVLTVRDVESGREICTIKARSWVNSVSWSPDGTRLASPFLDRTAGIYDAASGKEVHVLRGHSTGPLYPPLKETLGFASGKNDVWSVCWNPEGTRLASCGADQTVRVWDAASGKELYALKGKVNGGTNVLWSPDGSRFVVSNFDAGKPVRIWDAATGLVVSALKGSDKAYALAWSPDGKRLASASGDKTVRVWDVAKGRELCRQGVEGIEYNGLAWSPDGSMLASSFGGIIRILAFSR